MDAFFLFGKNDDLFRPLQPMGGYCIVYDAGNTFAV